MNATALARTGRPAASAVHEITANRLDVEVVVFLAATRAGIPANEIAIIPATRNRTAVQIASGRGTRPAQEAKDILRRVGAVNDIGVVDEAEGREWSGCTPDGTWVYVPARDLTPWAEAAAR